MMKFKSKRFGIRFGFGKRINNKGTQQDQQQKGVSNNNNSSSSNYEIKWELRPGGMLVQKRQESIGEDLISIRVSTFAHFHDLSIEATSTFGKFLVSQHLCFIFWETYSTTGLIFIKFKLIYEIVCEYTKTKII